MSEENKKVEQIEQEEKASEISDQELENAAGGAETAPTSTIKNPMPPCAIGGKDWGK